MHPRKSLEFKGKAKDDLCNGGRELNGGTSSLGGWSDAAFSGPVDGRQVPIGICDWLDVAVAIWAAPRSAMDFLTFQESGEGQSAL